MLSPTNWHVAVLGSEGSPEFDSGWSSHTGPFYVIHFDMVSYVLLLLCRRTSSAGWKCANILAIKAKIGNIVWTYHSALKLSQCRHCVKAEWTVRDNWTWRPWPIRGGHELTEPACYSRDLPMYSQEQKHHQQFNRRASRWPVWRPYPPVSGNLSQVQFLFPAHLTISWPLLRTKTCSPHLTWVFSFGKFRGLLGLQEVHRTRTAQLTRQKLRISLRRVKRQNPTLTSYWHNKWNRALVQFLLFNAWSLNKCSLFPSFKGVWMYGKAEGGFSVLA